ncbi:MAG: hypothetical protein FWC36_07915 [Spirochaetes bacterium]|nr:hypothetical protein [Spirochaetota bacterium]
MILSTIFNFFYPLQCSLCGAIIRTQHTASSKQLFCNKCEEIAFKTYTGGEPSLAVARSAGNTGAGHSLTDANSMGSSDAANRCRVCSRELISEIDICTICRKREYYFAKNISLWDYNNHHIKTLILNYKFKDKKKIAHFFADSIYKIYNINTDFQNIPVIPAPCSRKRIIKYGWDHMKYLSSVLSKKYYIETFNIFTKKKTKDQKELNYEKRQTALINQIKISDKNISKCLKRSNIAIFIDDVFTTGATASYCSKLLLDNGFKKVIVLTLALD